MVVLEGVEDEGVMHTPKPNLHLPMSDDVWKRANVFFKTDLVPRVLNEPSVNSKYTVLAEGGTQNWWSPMVTLEPWLGW